MQLLVATGRAAIAAGCYVLSIATFIGYALARLRRGRRVMPRVGHEVVKRQVLFTGVEALPFTALIALLTGAVVAVQASLLSAAGGTDLVGILLVTVLVRELGPLIVAFIVIGRSGAAIAAELASMRVHRELDSLEAMGVDPFDYLVVPRMAGVVMALIGLSMAFIAMSLLSGWAILQVVATTATPLADYANLLAMHLSGLDIAVALAKTVMPGLLIAAIACHEGLTAASSATDVPRAATRAVVRSLSVVFLWDAGITALVYLQ
jgi:phospholipid/cholesterol/gamma-HCH transport system permease protein